MYVLEEVIDSTSVLVEDKSKTITNINPVGIIGEVTQQRINSFLEEPSVEPERDENLNQAKLTTTLSDTIPDRKPIALVPKIPQKPKTFNSLQSWEGYVIEKYDDHFKGRITDLTEQLPDEEVEILLDDVSDDDLNLVVPGAIFYWYVGYETEKGTTKRSSIIRFRRMPRWTKSDFKKAEKIEKKIKKLFK